ncbi:ABC transporter permease [Amphibiibacter pelophylacis]|uniref:Sugar ABC transporter permease n=1 Tax=Amphibiibacter pelophylacis TaxID=1799477 RepID=A0ACC6P1D3_9BURK
MNASAARPPTDRRGWLVAPAFTGIVLLFVYPFLYGVYISFSPMEGGTFWSNYQQFFATPRQLGTIWVTLELAIPATLINVIGAIPIAYALRHSSRWQKWVTTILVIPVTLGTVLIANGMLGYFSPHGWFTQFVHWTGIYSQEVRLTHNYWSVLISLVISGFPFAFLLVLSYITGIDPVLARAAGTLGANPWQQFRTIYLPLLMPGLTMAASLSFVQAFSVFPSAVLLGVPAGATRVMSIAASEAAFENYDYSMASAIAMIMGCVQLASVLLIMALRKLFYTGPVTGGKG